MALFLLAPRSGALEVLLFESFASNVGKGLRVRGRIEQGPACLLDDEVLMSSTSVL